MRWRRWSRVARHLAVIGIGLIAPGCLQLDPYRYAERGVSRKLADRLGPAERYQVHLDRRGSRLRSGYLSHVQMSADDLVTKSGFQVRRLDADLYGLRFDPGTKAIRDVDRSSFTAFVTSEAANAYLARHDRGVPGLEVEFEPGTIVVHAAPKLLGLTVPVTLRGRGAAAGGDEIRFEADSVAVSRLNLPVAAVRLVEQRINPVFNVEDLRLPARVQSVESAAGELILRGEVKLP